MRLVPQKGLVLVLDRLPVRPEHFTDMVYQTCALTKGGCDTEMLVYGLAQDVSGY